MNAGELRHRIRINRMVDVQGDSFGEAKLTPVLYHDRVPALVEPLSGRELEHADKIQSGLTHRVKMRWMPGIEPKMQIVFNERTLNIVAALNIKERNVELYLMCMEEVRG